MTPTVRKKQANAASAARSRPILSSPQPLNITERGASTADIVGIRYDPGRSNGTLISRIPRFPQRRREESPVMIGVISDIHSNIHALEAVLDKLKQVDQIICLGDVVGYGAHPNECVERVKGLKIPCVLGNHDAACIGLLSLGWFNPHAANAVRWAMEEELTEESLRFLRGLPTSRRIEPFYLVHGSPREPTTEYLTDVSQARASFDRCKERVVFVGHTHVPLVFVERGETEVVVPSEGNRVSYEGARLIFNPGAVGQPRDGDPRAAYSIVDTSSNSIAQYRVEYNVQEARADIIEAGLPRILGDRLTLGC